MNGKTHRTIAMLSVVGLAACAFPTIPLAGVQIFPAIGLAVADAGGKIADVDIEGSSYGKKYPLMAKLCKHRGFTHTGIILLTMIAIFRDCALLHGSKNGVWIEDILIMFIITGGMNVSIKSRLTANLVTLIMELFILAFLTLYNTELINTILCSLVFGFFFSYASHIFADMHNRKGVPIAFPIMRKRVFLMAITTGTWEEYLFIGMYLTVMLGQIICTNFAIGLL